MSAPSHSIPFLTVSGHIAQARSMYPTADMFPEHLTILNEHLRAAIVLCKSTKSLIQQQEEREQLHQLFIERIKVEKDLSVYMPVYLEWIQMAITAEDLNAAKIYTEYARFITDLFERLRKEKEAAAVDRMLLSILKDLEDLEDLEALDARFVEAKTHVPVPATPAMQLEVYINRINESIASGNLEAATHYYVNAIEYLPHIKSELKRVEYKLWLKAICSELMEKAQIILRQDIFNKKIEVDNALKEKDIDAAKEDIYHIWINSNYIKNKLIRERYKANFQVYVLKLSRLDIETALKLGDFNAAREHIEIFDDCIKSIKRDGTREDYEKESTEFKLKLVIIESDKIKREHILGKLAESENAIKCRNFSIAKLHIQFAIRVSDSIKDDEIKKYSQEEVLKMSSLLEEQKRYSEISAKIENIHWAIDSKQAADLATAISTLDEAELICAHISNGGLKLSYEAILKSLRSELERKHTEFKPTAPESQHDENRTVSSVISFFRSRLSVGDSEPRAQTDPNSSHWFEKK